MADAVATLERAAETARRHGSAHTLAEIERDLGAALDAAGNPAGGRAARERAIALYRRLGADHAVTRLTQLLS
jgi:hypothetical protein